MDVQHRLDELAARHGLSAGQTDQLGRILNGLAKDDRAPTSVRDPGEAVDVHLADSLVALDVDRLRSAGRIADIGSGGGFPGLPLAVAMPASEVRLVESQSRKSIFAPPRRRSGRREHGGRRSQGGGVVRGRGRA